MNNYVLITGAAKRIGSIIATYLAKQQLNVVVHYNSSKKEAEDLVNSITKLGVKCIAIKADLNSPEEITSMFNSLKQQHKIKINTLINNASTFFYDDFSSYESNKWEQNFNTNLKAPLLLSQAMIDNLEHEESGNIINIIDQQISSVTTRFLSYNLAKVALARLTESLAKNLAPHVRVNGVAPGLTMKPDEMDQDRFDSMVLQKTLLNKTVAPLAIAETVWFLLNNPYITGEIIKVDCGEHIGKY